MDLSPGPSHAAAGSNLPTKPRRKVKPRSTLPGTGRFSVDDSPDPAPSQSIHRASELVTTTPSNAPSFQFKLPITPLSAVHPSLSRSQPTSRVEPDPLLSASPIPDPENSFSQFEEPFPHFEEPFPFHDTEYESVSARKRDGRSPTAKIHDHLRALRADKLSPLDILVQALDPDLSEDIRYRKNLYSTDDNRLTVLLDTIMKDDYGKRKLFECMHPHLEDFACNIVAEQMDCRRKASLLQGIKDVTPEFIDNWSLEDDKDRTPFLTRILEAAAQTTHAATHNKLKRPEKMCRVVTKQLLYQSSNRCLGFQAEFGLFLWSTGCARQTIDALFRCGLSVGYDSVLNLVESLSYHCDALALEFSKGLHGFCYDNMNISTSIHVEQRGSAGPAKVQSGTFCVLYRLLGACPEHMLIAPMMQRFRSMTGLQFNRDIRPTFAQLESCHDQLVVVVIDCLREHITGFDYLAKDPLITHKALRALPDGYFTEECPVRASTTEEATVRGNLLFHDEIYIHHLKHTPESLSKYAIPGFHDQLTNARIRAAQIMRAKDVDAWSRREIFQLGFGLFHMCLNLVWAILHIHRGTINETGSLSYFFALMEKTRLGNDQPDYHTLLAALTQILDGLLLNAWHQSSGHPSLKDFAEAKPTASRLREIATRILTDLATPLPSPLPPAPPSSDSSDDEAHSSEPESTANSTPLPAEPSIDPTDDIAHQNIRILMRDLLVLVAVVRAIADGDIGRVEVFFPHLAMMFRGAGCNKYCTEILHFLVNLKHVWTPEFANIMRDNMIVRFGPGHCMGTDMNIEHLIGYLKTLLKAKGMSSTWDRLGNISAAIVHLQRVKKKINSALEGSHRSTRHTTPDTSNMVFRVQRKAAQEALHKFEPERANNDPTKAVLDIQLVGEQKLKSSTLGTFNKKVLAMAAGIEFEEDEDECPAVSFIGSCSLV
ncbi:hypothetical protein C8F04DRAFT_1400755 [Mycena alexandri]|uniref:DUF6589 domain-containing protein n=1 Tax=Mycena alexandri TaxID=1745969 RepID=A0AAD6SE05_9AGAR|nr:hypothetical protein C8F04DRAFT_1400755 [Mycena alexandri]